MVDQSPKPQPLVPSASAEEAAAIVAALGRFMGATAPAAASIAEDLDPWLRAAILEGVSRAQQDDSRDPWINT